MHEKISFVRTHFAFALGCKKKHKESTWTVNGETFSTVAITSLGKARTGLSSNDYTNRFGLIFYLPAYLPVDGNNIHNNFSIAFTSPYFPTTGTLTIATPSTLGSGAIISFTIMTSITYH